MKKVKMFSLIMTALLLAVITLGSGGVSFAATLTEEEVGSKHVVLLIKNRVNPFFTEMADAVEVQAAEYGWTVEVLAPITPDNNEEQIQLLEQALLNPPDGFLIVPADSHGITPAIEQINRAGIPIVNVNTLFYDPDIEYITYVGIENYKLAYSGIEAINKRFDQPGKAILIEGVTGAQTSIDRTNGATDAFRDLGWELLAAQTANYNRTEAVTVTQSLLQAHPDVDAIFAASGEMGLGCAIALEQANMKDRVILGCINAYQEIIQAVADGRIDLTADDDSRMQGAVGLQCLMKFFQGIPQEKITFTPSTIVDESNLHIYKERFGIQ